MQNTAQYFIDQLKMEAHPEGGFYVSTYRGNEQFETRNVARPIYTSIYFLLRSQDISQLASFSRPPWVYL